jgi:type I restriction enzyme S subunit
MTLTGENKTDIATAVVYEGQDEIAMGGDMTCWSHHGMESLYLVYLMNSPYAIGCKRKLATGDIIVHISNEKLSSILLPLPPLAEQKRIVAKIEELMPLVERYEKAWSKLKDFNKRFPADMQKSLLQLAIQGKLVEQRAEEGTGEELYRRLKSYHLGLKPCKDELDYSSMNFTIPANWTMIELNQLFDFVDYRGKTPNKTTSGVFLITASNIRQAYMDYTRKEYISRDEYQGRQSRGLTQKGDLLFTTEAPMGNAALCDLDECSCGQRIITFKEYVKGTALPTLYMYFILAPQFQQQLLDNCTGTTAKGIKADKLKHFLIPLPPLAEQKRIVAKLEEILPLCERLK